MPYLSVAEYVTRFGERETTLFTNTTTAQGGVGVTYDAPKVEAALDDATEEVEGYIAKRYTTPLDAPPKIVKGWVAAIARLKLAETTGRVADAIKDAADRATRQLEQLVANKLDLPIDEGSTSAPVISSGGPLTSGDRPRSTFGSLDAFTAPFTRFGEACAPRWIRDNGG